MVDKNWIAPKTFPDIDASIHVWRVDLTADEERLAAARSLLSDDERARADRFKFDWLRRRYTVGRATLRVILAGYTGTDAREIAFSYGPQGKPALASHAADLAFNVSDSEDLALVAVGRCPALGVDLEHMRAERACRDIARRFFANEEIAALERLPPDRYSDGFYRCWTRKEAFIKALGGGLSIPLTSFAVSVGEDPRLLSVDDANLDPRDWTLVSLAPAENFLACVAAQANTKVDLFRWLPNSAPR